MKIPIASIEFEPTVDPFPEEIKARKDKVETIAESMKEIGLLHPVTVREVNGSYKLIAGENRLLAAKAIGWTDIDAEVKDVTDTEQKIMEIHENLQRFDIGLWEEVDYTAALHELRQAQHGAGETGRPSKDAGKIGWGIRDTANELGKALGPVAENLQLHRAVMSNPSLRNIKDKKTAVRLVRVEARRFEAEEEAGLSAPPDLDVNQAFLGDSSEILSRFPQACIDVCITDPPWINYRDESLVFDKDTLNVFKQVHRVLRMRGFLYLFAGFDDYSYYCGFDRRNEKGQIIHTKGKLEEIGFNIAKTPIIWCKEGSVSRVGVLPWEYMRNYELIIVATKGAAVLTSPTGLSGFKVFNTVPTANQIHPNEKPIELIEELLQECSYDGSIVLDPFGGSFVVADAARNMDRRYIICERDKKYYYPGRKRLGI